MLSDVVRELRVLDSLALDGVESAVLLSCVRASCEFEEVEGVRVGVVCEAVWLPLVIFGVGAKEGVCHGCFGGEVPVVVCVLFDVCEDGAPDAVVCCDAGVVELWA